MYQNIFCTVPFEPNALEIEIISHLSNSGRAADIFSSLHLSPEGKDKELNSFWTLECLKKHRINWLVERKALKFFFFKPDGTKNQKSFALRMQQFLFESLSKSVSAFFWWQHIVNLQLHVARTYSLFCSTDRNSSWTTLKDNPEFVWFCHEEKTCNRTGQLIRIISLQNLC